MKFSVPVSPYVGRINDEDDVVFSLVDLAPTKDIRFKAPDGPLELSEVQLEVVQSSVEVLAELGITSAVTVTNKFKGDTISFNVELLAKGTVQNEITGGLIDTAELGVGFRIGVIAFNFKNEADVATPALLAASSTLGVSSSLFEVSVLGAGLEALPAVKPLILASVGPFDMSTFQTLGAVQVALSEYLINNTAALTPVLMSVSVDAARITSYAYPTGTSDFKADALAQTYAFERAYHDATLKQALADKRVKERNLNVSVIENVYTGYLKLTPDQKPTTAAKADAFRVLDAGRW